MIREIDRFPGRSLPEVKHLRYMLAAQLVLFLGLLLPVLLVAGLERIDWSLGAVLAWSIAAYCGVRLGMLAVSGEKRLIRLTFYVFVYVWLGVAPLLQLLSGSHPLPGTYSSTTVLSALGVVIVGLAAYEVGGWLCRKPQTDLTWLDRRLLRRQLSVRRGIAVGVVGALIALGLVYHLGGIDSIVTSRTDLTLRVQQKTGAEGSAGMLLYMIFLRVPVFVAGYVLLVAFLHVERSWRLALMTLFLAAVNLLISNPFSSSRTWFGVVVLSVLYVILPWHRNNSFAIHAACTVLLLLFIFPHSDLFRRTMQPEIGQPLDYNPLVHKMDYDAFQQLMNSLHYVEEHGLSWGKQILGALLFWVPRALWSGKPLHSGQLVAEASGYSFHNLSLPLWGEAYLDGGWIALILLFLGYGFLTVRVEQISERSEPAMDRWRGLVVPVYAAFQIILLRGTLMSSLAYLTPVVGILVICTTVPRPSDDRPTSLATARIPLRPFSTGRASPTAS